MPVGRCSSELSSHKLQAKSKKSQPLSEAPRRPIAYQRALWRGVEEPSCAESKDPGDACWQLLFGAFRPQTTREIRFTASDRSVPGFPATPHWTKPRVRLSVREGRMKCTNATKILEFPRRL